MIAGLYRRYAPELVRYIRKYTEDQAAAEDIVQGNLCQRDGTRQSAGGAGRNHSAGPGCIGRQKISALIVPRRVQAEPPGREKPFRMTTDKADGNAAVRNFGAAGQSDVLASVF